MGAIAAAQLEEGELALPLRYRLQVVGRKREMTMELDERVLTALRAENGPLVEGRELAIIARAYLAELRRARIPQHQ